MISEATQMRMLEIAHAHGNRECQRLFDVMRQWLGAPISPIEALMGAALAAEMPKLGGSIKVPALSILPMKLDDVTWPEIEGFHAFHQVRYEPYVADFLVNAKIAGMPVQAVIECDGHDFHERTKEQASHDKARDRRFQALGLMVLRYTGSDIHADPEQCAHDALSTIAKAAYARKA